jgi:hypothetical protein
MLQRLKIMQHRSALYLAFGVAIGLSIGLVRSESAEKPDPLGTDLPWQDARMLAEVLERVKQEFESGR